MYEPVAKARKDFLAFFHGLDKCRDIFGAPDGNQHANDRLIGSPMERSTVFGGVILSILNIRKQTQNAYYNEAQPALLIKKRRELMTLVSTQVEVRETHAIAE